MNSKFSSVCTLIAFSTHEDFFSNKTEVIYYCFSMPNFQDEKNQWVKSSNGQAPPGTLVGGVDITGEPIYVSRASHNGDLIPGKMVASHRCAYISWGGLEFSKNEYEVLVGSSNNWIATKNSNVPDNALIAGKTDIGDTLYVGRVHLQESITPGKVHKYQGICYIPFNGKELRFSEYEVLVS